MSLLIVFVVFLLVCVAYVGFVIHKKEINPKEIRVSNFQDAKKLLTLPSTADPQRYLAKRA
ncbi:PREDICTED: uncharacterized protein LOC108615646 [Drosophila arizonae]|uniref:Uncharacterized protein LOC108615646 n=1 Tax=Drosophila arizonae TaxID=7263 RepID=A0ABM1PEZ3_DROAR|nr:PREDICTED: uncharacterized protein LOC108615646 [Drosophila arizonae]